jgi:hypothetical protein
MRKTNILIGIALGFLVLAILIGNLMPSFADLWSTDKIMNQVRQVVGATAPTVALQTSRNPGTGVYLSASGVVNNTAGSLWGFTVNPSASSSWSLYLYDSPSAASGTLLYRVDGVSGASVDPTPVNTYPLKATTGIYAQLTNATASFLYEP